MTTSGGGGVSRSDHEPAEGFLARWAVVVEMEASSNDIDAAGRPRHETVERWFEGARRSYLDRCLALREEVRSGRADVRVDDLRIACTGPIESGQPVLVAVTVTELRPTSFDMALRVRGLGGPGTIVASGRCTFVLAEPGSDAALTLPDGVRHEVLALESDASDYC
jgi:acyl-CoA thioesterase FadM